MLRSIWNGTITFGLIAVPIKVHSATEDHAVHFHQVHDRDGARIRQKRICGKERREVPYSEVAKGYQVREGEYVVLSQDEIDAAAGRQAHVIELEEFVCQAEIDPVFYEKTYYLGAGADGQDAYRLLHDALRRSKRAGLGRWVFHNREYLVAIRALDGALALHTMRFADELVAADDLDLPAPAKPPSSREIEMAGMLVDSLHGRFDPSAFSDTYRDRVMELIEAKARGEQPELTPPSAPEQAGDLMAALEASLKGAGSKQGSSGGKTRSSSGKAQSGGGKSGGRGATKRTAGAKPTSKPKARS